MRSHRRYIELDNEYKQEAVPETPREFCPLRMLALAVLAQAIVEIEFMARRGRKQNVRLRRGVAGIANEPAEWLARRDLVEPWCEVAEINPDALRRRVERIQQRRKAA